MTIQNRRPLAVLVPLLLLAACSQEPAPTPAPQPVPRSPRTSAVPADRVAVPAPGPLPAPGEQASAAEVLAWWDEVRRQSWADGDVAKLHAMYAPGSRAGEADVANLRAYEAAGVTLRGWQTQRRSVRQLVRRGDVVRALVTSAQRDVTVSLLDDPGEDPGTARTLPRTSPRRLAVTLRWSSRLGWRVAEVRPVSPSAPTAPRAAPAPRRGGRS